MLWGNYQIYLMILYGILFLSDITDKIYEFMDLNRETQPDRSVAELFSSMCSMEGCHTSGTFNIRSNLSSSTFGIYSMLLS